MRARSDRFTLGFTLLEAMVVLAMIGVVVGVASSVVVALMTSAKSGRAAVAAITSTRAAVDFVADEARSAGGPSLPATARVLIDKGGGARGTDILWIVDENVGYGQCTVIAAGGGTLTFPVVRISGTDHCCFEAGAAPPTAPPVASPLAPGPPFRRNAVLSDVDGRFLPLFLQGSPSTGSCSLTVVELPGMNRVVNTGLGNLPDLVGSVVTLADVKRVSIDFGATGVRPPFGALFVHTEIDGNVASDVGERMRVSSNTLDVRFAVAYSRVAPEVADEDLDDPDDTDADVTFDVGDNPLFETAGNRRSWVDSPVPAAVGVAGPAMLGIALETGLKGVGSSTELPWSSSTTAHNDVRVFHLISRVAFRDAARR